MRFNPPKGFPSRPTTDFAKEGLFNLIDNEFDLQNLKILDLFAGTGNISFEFASREAGNITAVDNNFKCTGFIKTFADKHELDSLHVIKSDVLKFLKNHSQSYDLIFADPPFDSSIYEAVIESVMEGELLKENGLFILEHDKHRDFSAHSKFRNSRKYGHIIFSFFEHN